jgi:hypothetical protein
MALELTIYNRQTQTSRSGKEYIGYVVAFAPGQRGAILQPLNCPLSTSETSEAVSSGSELEARTLADAKTEAQKQQHILQHLIIWPSNIGPVIRGGPSMFKLLKNSY